MILQKKQAMNTKALYPMMYLTLGHVCFCVLKVFLKKFKFFYFFLCFKLIFF